MRVCASGRWIDRAPPSIHRYRSGWVGGQGRYICILGYLIFIPSSQPLQSIFDKMKNTMRVSVHMLILFPSCDTCCLRAGGVHAYNVCRCV
jgi:hypothetical protein